MPVLSAELLEVLVSDAVSDEVVAPESESRRGLEPLCAWYGVGCREAIEVALDRGDRHVISFFPDVRVRKIPIGVVARFGDPAVLFLNVNKPDDRQRAEEAVRRMEGVDR
jgi:molybdopterin-guanine dinucleotide biosynthesis protein A